MNLCSIAGCKKPVRGHGYCNKHYLRLKRHGDPNYIWTPKTCSIEGCNRVTMGRGYCNKHWQRWYKYGNPNILLRRTPEKHGLRNIPEYDVWHAMRDRCSSSKNKYYARYGGRGISVCERWTRSFKAFYDDMGPRPFFKAEIDRIDNDGNYEPSNCRWVTREVNQKNRIRLRKRNGQFAKVPVDPERAAAKWRIK